MPINSKNSNLRQATLVILRKMVGEQTQICLAEKKRGFGVGKWNGIGGKVEKGETIIQAAIRETLEEIKVQIEPNDLEQVATINFIFEHQPEWNQQVHIFFADKWQGEPQETDEMRPEWFSLEEIPFDLMWADEKFWLPRILRGEKLNAEFAFDKNEKIIYQNIVPTNLQDYIL